MDARMRRKLKGKDLVGKDGKIRKDIRERHKSWREEAEQKAKEKYEKIEKRAKPLHELLRTASFTVDDVISQSYTTRISPHSDMMIGGTSSSYAGGYVTGMEIKVTPEKDIHTATLVFYGISIIKAGDKITALIPAYKEEDFSEAFYRPPKRILYVPRGYKKVEHPIEIAILDKLGNNTVRRDRSIKYDTFMEKE